MTMADIFAIAGGLIIVGLSFPALFIVLNLTFPRITEKAKERLDIKPTWSLLTGLAAFLLFFLVTVIFGKAPIGPLKIVGLLSLLSGLSLSMIGGAGLVGKLADRYRILTGSKDR